MLKKQNCSSKLWSVTAPPLGTGVTSTAINLDREHAWCPWEPFLILSRQDSLSRVICIPFGFTNQNKDGGLPG